MHYFLSKLLLLMSMVSLLTSTSLALIRQQTPHSWQLVQDEDGYLYRRRDNGERVQFKSFGRLPLYELYDVSPDGKSLILTVPDRQDDRYTELFRLDLRHGKSHKLAAYQYTRFDDWTPDSEWIIYQYLSLSGSNGVAHGVYKTRIDGSQTQQIADGYVFFESLSPDGQGILISSPSVEGIFRVNLSGDLQKERLTPQQEQTYLLFSAVRNLFSTQNNLLPPIELPYRAWLLPLISLIVLATRFISRQRRNNRASCVNL